MATPDSYPVACWHCLGEFDALGAVWCSDDPKTPTKLCPFCLHCFCAADEQYKQNFWRNAPARLREELRTLGHSQDRLGGILMRMQKLTTPQLLEALEEQQRTGRKLGEILIAHRWVAREDVETALRTQGVAPLTDTAGAAFSGQPVWEHSDPDAILDYLLALAVRKGASDVLIEPRADAIGVRYRIDGFSFRLDPIPKSVQEGLSATLCQRLGLEPGAERCCPSRTTARIAGQDYDLVAQAWPTLHGAGAVVKLVNRATFIKDFVTLGLELEDRVRLLETLRSGFGLVLVSAPVYNGARTTLYSIMSFFANTQQDVVSLETPVQWPFEGVRQLEVPDEPGAMARALRAALAIHPDVLLLSALPDAAAARLVTQIASSLLVVVALPASSAVQALGTLQALDVPPAGTAAVLSAVLCQRLVRRICTICREPTAAPAPRTLALHGLGADEAATLQFFRGRGCPTCNRVGYRGRRAIFEILSGAPEVKAAVAAGRPPRELAAAAVAAGMHPLRERCLALVREGVTTFDEFTRLRLDLT